MAKRSDAAHPVLPPAQPSAGLPEGWTPAQAIKAVLASTESARPAVTVAGLLRRLLAVRAACGEPGPLPLHQFFWMMAFSDWMYLPPRPADAEDLVQVQAILAEAMRGPAGPALPPEPPIWPPQGTPARIRNAMWEHLDLLGLRTLALRQCLGATDSLDPYADPYAEFPLLVELAGQLGQRRSWKRDDPDLQGLLDRMAEVLETCHRVLDRVEAVEGLRLPAGLAWLRPGYPAPAHAPAPAAEAEAALSPSLQEELRAALAERGSGRPLATMAPLARLYGQWRRSHQPGWRWDPAMDGRELAFMLFDTTPDDPGPWTAAQARRFTALSDRVFRLQVPVAPLPPFPRQPDAPGAAEALWRHVDHFATCFVLGLMGGGILPSPPWPRNTPPEIKAHVEIATETLAQLHSLLHDWSGLAAQERQDALENVSGALAMFQELHLGLLQRMLPAHSTLLDPVRFPFTFELPAPRKRTPKVRPRSRPKRI